MKNIDEMTIAEARSLIPQMKELLAMFGETSIEHASSALPYPVGTPVYVRGAIYSVTGRVVSRDGEWIHLSEAAYVTTDGRFGEASEKGIQNVAGSEIEPVGGDRSVAVNIGATSDVTIHPEPLPSELKEG